MASVSLRLLGVFQCTVGDQLITGFATDKVRALFGYLAVEASRPHPRSALAALLWPNLSQELADNNLRKSLSRLRKTLEGAAPGASAVLAVTRKTVQFVAAGADSGTNSGAEVDLLTLQRLLAECQTHEHAEFRACDSCLDRMARVVDLYQGELMAGLSLADASVFEEWLQQWRETIYQQIILALSTLSAAYEWRGEIERANQLTSELLALDPYREEAQRQKMRLLAKMGLPTQAVEHYENFRRLIQQELGLEVEGATTELAQQIRNNGPQGAEAQPAVAAFISQADSQDGGPHSPSAALQNLKDVPLSGRVYGRRQESERLIQWLTQEQARLIVLVGMGGIGKTTIASTAARMVANQFDLVLWRSVINAPPLGEILRDWLAILAENSLVPLPQSLDGQLALLLDHLRARRCLLVLDNLESIFQPDLAGQMRPDHRGYMQLLQRIAETHHQSCLLLTSRELPQGFARLEEDLPWVHMLALDGLDMPAAQALLHDRGLSGERGATVSLVERYSGNPLALKLVAETAQGLFAGDINAFLVADTLIFDDIRAVLDWQFDRLPQLEQEILIWFAIEREPISIQTLRENLSPSRPLSEVLVAVRGLQRRSLLERVLATDSANDAANARPPEAPILVPQAASQVGSQAASTFVLQNVLMEYLIDRLVEAASQELEDEEVVRLHHHALIKAQAKEYVRQSQVRLILQRVANRLLAASSKDEIGRKIGRILSALRDEPQLPGGYAAGSLLNLLLLLEIDVTGYDFSHLPVWQADLRRAQLPGVNFSGAEMNHTFFVDGFDAIFEAVYTPDGSCIVAATDSGEVRVWQAGNGRLLRSFAGHLGTVRVVATSPNGALIASGGEDNTVRVWNFAGPQGQGAQILQGHSGRVTSVAFHPDGKRLASAGVDQSIRLWNLASGETTAILQGHEGWIWSLAFHPNGETLASAGNDQVIRLWDVERTTTRALLSGHSAAVSTLAYDPQGKHLVSGSLDRSVRVWDVESGETIQRLEASLDAIWRVVFSPDGTLLASAGDDRVARIWDWQSGSILHTLHGHKDVIFALAFSPAGEMLVTGSADQSLRLWDLPDPRIRQIIAGPNQIMPTIAFHPNGKLIVSGHHSGMVRFWDAERKTLHHSLADPQRFIDVIAFSRALMNPGPIPGTNPGPSRDGAWLASGGDDLQLWWVDGEGRIHERHHLQMHRGRVFALAFNPSGSLLASGSLDQVVYLWDVQRGQLQQSLPGYEAPIYSMAFSPNGSLLATGSATHSIHLWDAESGQLCHHWHAHSNAVWALAFSPDGQTLISCGGDGLICLWEIGDPTQPRLRATLRGHSDRVYALALSADGQRLYSGSADRTIRVWDLTSQQPVEVARGQTLGGQSLQGHTRWVWGLSLSADGKTLASCSLDETIRLWETESGEALAVLVAPGPYAGMKIEDVRGITEAEKATLKLMGAVEG